MKTKDAYDVNETVLRRVMHRKQNCVCEYNSNTFVKNGKPEAIGAVVATWDLQVPTLTI